MQNVGSKLLLPVLAISLAGCASEFDSDDSNVFGANGLFKASKKVLKEDGIENENDVATQSNEDQAAGILQDSANLGRANCDGSAAGTATDFHVTILTKDSNTSLDTCSLSEISDAAQYDMGELPDAKFLEENVVQSSRFEFYFDFETGALRGTEGRTGIYAAVDTNGHLWTLQRYFRFADGGGWDLDPEYKDPTLHPVEGETFRKVVTGDFFICGLTHSGKVFCKSILGVFIFQGFTYVAGLTDEFLEVDLNEKEATDIVAGILHACALLEDGTVSCFGENTSNQLGAGSNLLDSNGAPVPKISKLGVPTFPGSSPQVSWEGIQVQISENQPLENVLALHGGSYGTNTCATIRDEDEFKTYCWGVVHHMNQNLDGNAKPLDAHDNLVDCTIDGAVARALTGTAPNAESMAKQCTLYPQEVNLPENHVVLEGISGLAHNCFLVSELEDIQDKGARKVFCMGSNKFGQLDFSGLDPRKPNWDSNTLEGTFTPLEIQVLTDQQRSEQSISHLNSAGTFTCAMLDMEREDSARWEDKAHCWGVMNLNEIDPAAKRTPETSFRFYGRFAEWMEKLKDR